MKFLENYWHKLTTKTLKEHLYANIISGLILIIVMTYFIGLPLLAAIILTVICTLIGNPIGHMLKEYFFKK